MEQERKRSMRHTTTKTYSLPPELQRKAARRAKKEGVPESTIIRWALEAYLAPTKSTAVLFDETQKEKQQ